MKVILRWIAVLPAAAIGAFVAHIFFTLMSGLMNGFANPDPTVISLPRVLGAIATDAIVGFTFVFVGVATAPNRKNEVSAVLATFYTIFVIFGIYLNYVSDGPFMQYLNSTATALGAIFASVSVYKNKEKLM